MLALGAGAHVLFDWNLRPHRRVDRDEAIALARIACDGALLVRLNADEALLLAGEAEPGRAAEAVTMLGCRLAIVTLGGRGALLRGEADADAPGVPATVVDTTGAGDALMGVVLAALISSHHDPRRRWCVSSGGGRVRCEDDGAFRSARNERIRDTVTDVVCLGILVADVVARPVDALPAIGTLALVDSIVLRGGGCALNTSSALARLGLRAAVLGKVGTDPFGDFVVALLRERGVDGAGVIRDPTVPTSASVALVDSAGERTFLHTPGANDALHVRELGEAPFAGRALHVAGALVLKELDGEPTATLLAEARRRGLHTSLDTVFDASGRWERVLPAIPHCDLVTPGRAEAQAISGERDPARAARRLRQLGAGVAAVTLGADGCHVAADDFDGRVPAVPVDAVDGTGAGDAFVAGFLCGRLAGWATEACARFANAAGALATTAVGAFEGVGDLERTRALAEAA